MKYVAHVLLVEDDAALAKNLRQVLEDEKYRVTHTTRGNEGLDRALAHEFDVVLTDLRLPGLGGLELIRRLQEKKPRLPAVLMTAHATVEAAIEATKSGAIDYLQKPFEMTDLLSLLEKVVEARRIVEECAPSVDRTGFTGPLVGNSRALWEVFKEIGRIADKPVTVLIRGETGSGKELIARAIYQHSGRSKGPFLAINCAAIPENLLESELFGHERGAFTGAEQRRIGRFEQAHLGTLFLDEIGDLPPAVQVKLLRVLQEKCIQRVGGSQIIPVDVRILAATHRPLERMIQEGSFREDLFYRLSVATISLPPLRERKEDILVLAHHFLHKYSEEFGCEVPVLTPDALMLLQGHSWPGNVRELENVLRRLILSARGLPIQSGAVSEVLAGLSSVLPATPSSLAELVTSYLNAARRGEISDIHSRLLAQTERELLTQAIALAAGNQSQVARWLGLSRLTLREKLMQLGLHPQQTEIKADDAPLESG